MSVPDNMKFVLFAVLIFLPVAAQAQQGGYELDAWFGHNHLSTHDCIYTQDADFKSHSEFIPVHLSLEDLAYLDSIATAVGFWTFPDTIFKLVDTVRVDGKLVYLDEITIPGPGRTSFYFQTPTHRKSLEILDWQNAKAFYDKISSFENGIQTVLQRQQYYNTLPRPVMRY